MMTDEIPQAVSMPRKVHPANAGHESRQPTGLVGSPIPWTSASCQPSRSRTARCCARCGNGRWVASAATSKSESDRSRRPELPAEGAAISRLTPSPGAAPCRGVNCEPGVRHDPSLLVAPRSAGYDAAATAWRSQQGTPTTLPGTDQYGTALHVRPRARSRTEPGRATRSETGPRARDVAPKGTVTRGPTARTVPP